MCVHTHTCKGLVGKLRKFRRTEGLMVLLLNLFCRVSEVAPLCLAKAVTSVLYICCLPTGYVSVQGVRSIMLVIMALSYVFL